MIMKKSLLSITIVVVCFSGNYSGTSKTIKSNQTLMIKEPFLD